MRNVVAMFREYARLDLRRLDRGLRVEELERWQQLQHTLEKEFRLSRPPGAERRSSRRVKTRLNCSYASSHELQDAMITDLATGGVFIETRCPLPVGTELELRIRMEDADAEIRVDGVVVSNHVGPRMDTGQPGMGIRFARVGVAVLDQISALYAEHVGREMNRPSEVDPEVDGPSR